MKTSPTLLVLFAPTLAFASDGRLGGPVRPTAEAIDLILDPAEPSYTGEAKLTLEVSETTDAFEIHAEDLDLRGATLTKGNRTWDVEITQTSPSRAAISSTKKLKPGTYTLAITFENDLDESGTGLYRFEVDGTPFVASQFQADEARTAWPAFDEPSYKIPWTVKVEAPDDLQVVSNTPVAERIVDGGWQTVTFETTPPTSSYLLALAVGPFVGVPVQGMEGHVWTLPGTEPQAAWLAKDLAPTVEALAEWFGQPYPYGKLDWVVVPEFAYGAMENPGAVIARPELALVDPETSSPSAVEEVARTVGHETAHMWFGDLVTMAWWDDLWLNETFAEWMSYKTVAKLHPELDPRTRAIAAGWGALSEDGYATSRPLRTEVDPDHVFETTNVMAAYFKGTAVLDMMESWLGADTVRAGLRAYVAKHAWGNATIDDLVAALSEASGKDVASVLRPWLDQPGAPLLAFTPGDDGSIVVRQSPYTIHGAEAGADRTWKVPVTLRYATGDEVRTASFLLEGQEMTVPLADGPVRWVYPTVDGVGYFAWNQPEASMRALLADAGKALTPHERLALVLDLAALGQSGALSGGQVLDLLANLDGETEPIVVSAMVSRYALLEQVAPEELKPVVAEVIRETFRPALDALTTEVGPDDDARTRDLRGKLISWLGTLGEDPEVIAFSQEQTARFLDDPTSVDPSIAAQVLHVAGKHGDLALQQKLLDAARATPNAMLHKALLAAAASVPGEEAEAKALALAISGELVDYADTFVLVSAVFDEESEADEALAWAMEHHDALVASLPAPFRPYLLGFGASCDLDRLERAKTFYLDPAREVPGSERIAAQLTEEVGACVAQRELHRDSVVAFLERWSEAHDLADGG